MEENHEFSNYFGNTNNFRNDWDDNESNDQKIKFSVINDDFPSRILEQNNQVSSCGKPSENQIFTEIENSQITTFDTENENLDKVVQIRELSWILILLRARNLI